MNNPKGLISEDIRVIKLASSNSYHATLAFLSWPGDERPKIYQVTDADPDTARNILIDVMIEDLELCRSN